MTREEFNKMKQELEALVFLYYMLNWIGSNFIKLLL